MDAGLFYRDLLLWVEDIWAGEWIYEARIEGNRLVVRIFLLLPTKPGFLAKRS